MTARTLSAAICALTALLALSPLGVAEEEGQLPAPDVDRVVHASPQDYVGIPPRVGDPELIQALARQLRAESPDATLQAIGRWLGRNLRHDPGAPPRWRTLQEMIDERSYGGCDDYSVAFGTLARACGIPTVWVKTMDLAWIDDFWAGRPGHRAYRGHVFLEVHLGGTWCLLDTTTMHLWRNHDTKARILPGCRYAYDRGGDPWGLVLSCRWDDWVRQAETHFSAVKRSQVPWGGPEDLLRPWRIWIAAPAESSSAVSRVARQLGYLTEMTFDSDAARVLPSVRGGIVLVTSQRGRPALPEALWDAWLPAGFRQALADAGAGEGFTTHRKPDGTRVILLTVDDPGAVHAAVAKALAALR